MSNNAWAGDTDAPLTLWLDGTRIYAQAKALPMTAAQARAAVAELLHLINTIEQGDPHAGAVLHLDSWKARRAGQMCSDCDNDDTPCTCQIAERPYLPRTDLLTDLEQKR